MDALGNVKLNGFLVKIVRRLKLLPILTGIILSTEILIKA
jgi:hypothetical protein